MDTQGHCHGDESAAGASKSLVVDAGKFLAERNLIGQFKVSELMDFFSCYNICFVAGRNGFSSNIRTIEGDILNIMMLKIIPHTHTHTHSYTVTDTRGTLTGIAQDAILIYTQFVKKVSDFEFA